MRNPFKDTFIHYLALIIICQEVIADFGDFADDDGDFKCPAFTTCPVACVANLTDCPVDLACPEGTTLCVDGNCASIADGGCDPELTSPCELECATVACMKVNDFFDNCNVTFETQYAFAAECEIFVEENLFIVDQTGPGFIFFYFWISFLTFCVYIWCAYNQYFKPVEDSTKVLFEAVKDFEKPKEKKEEWTQTFYRRNYLGDIIYAMTIITLAGFHVLLGIFTIFYYWQQESVLLNYAPIYEDEAQVLFIFEVIWMVGFFWSIAFKYNPSVRSIFLRRCRVDLATHVAVFAPYKDPTSDFNMKDEQLSNINKVQMMSLQFLASIGRFLFSDYNRPETLGSYTFCPVKVDKFGNKWFSFRLRRYIYDEKDNMYMPSNENVGEYVEDLLNGRNGLTTDQVTNKRLKVGPNKVDIPKPSFIRVLVAEFGKTFYHYQMYMIWTWFPYWYFYMATVNALVVSISGISVSFFLYRNQRKLHSLAQINGTVDVLRNESFSTVDYSDLVPGDVIRLSPGIVYSDMVIISGNHVLLDESALTGETSPINKTQLENTEGRQIYDPVTFKKNTIFAGTTINEVGSSSLAVITQTGSYTTKGELLRDILSYHRHMFKFDIEVELVILILFVWAVICFSIVVWMLEDSPVYSWFYGMFVVSTCIPMLLPTVFVVSVGVSERRLEKSNVTCVNPESILVAGKVKIAFFDKTGTLTKQGLEFNSIRSIDDWDSGDHQIPKDSIEAAMSLCHSLTISQNGELVGNSVDKIMFQASKATMNRSETALREIKLASGEEFKVIKQFEFDSHRMTQSVIVKDQQEELTVFVKGSAENIKMLCESDSLPHDFDPTLKESAKDGVYQISVAMKHVSGALAKKYLNNEDIDRDEVERDLSFIGFINFKNMLREETPDVLRQLKGGDIKSVMLTGDSVFTGIKIARESGLIDSDTRVILGDKVSSSGDINWHDVDSSSTKADLEPIRDVNLSSSNVSLAVTAYVWRHLIQNEQEYALLLCEHISVYGRCTPQDKISVVSTFIHKGNITLMCGDGGNDCGALKTAHVGIALSDAEASVVSPFTSLEKSITSVLDVLKEGRCALASAFSSYKYMLMYGQLETVIQMGTAYFFTTFSEWCWIFLDGVWLVTMAFTLPLAKPAKVLAPKRPTSSLFGWQTLSSYLGVLFLNLIFLIVALDLLFRQDWFQCRMWGSTDVANILIISDNYETETLFIITGFQYIISACVFNFGFTHRAMWIKNYAFMILVTGFIIVHIYITLVPGYLSCFWRVNCDNEHVVRELTTVEPQPIANPFHTTIMPTSFRVDLLIIMIINLISITVWEFFIVDKLVPFFIDKYKARKAAGDANKMEKKEFLLKMGALV